MYNNKRRQVKNVKSTRGKITHFKKAVKKKKKEGKKSSQNGNSFFSFFKSQRMIQVYGLILIVFALLLFISIISYFCHTSTDNSHVLSSTNPDNIAGTVGAHLAYFFVNYFFGIFSFGFSLIFFLFGVKLTFNKQLLPLLKTFVTTLLTMAWFSLVLGTLFAKSGLDFIAGAFGNFTSQFLLQYTGKLPTFFIILILFFVILILCYNFSMNSLLKIRFPKIRNSRPEKGKNDKKVVSVSSKKEDKDTELPGLYVANPHELSKEYGSKVYEFDVDDSEIVEPLSPETDTQTQTQTEEPVPFEIIDRQSSTDTQSFSEETLPETDDDVLVDDDYVDENENVTEDNTLPLEDYDPRKDLSTYKIPSIDLLNDYQNKENNEEVVRELTENKEKIERTLRNFNIPIKRIFATVGPTVTLYEIVPDDGVRISKIKNLEDDIALSLAALGIRIIAPIPGKGTIGIEVPNKNPNLVSMKEIITSDKFINNKYDLPIGLGKTINNEPFVVDLAKMPHLLMAGATGQGKSVGLNAIITSLLYKKHPSELKLVLVDPKKVEFTLYASIENHYLAKLPNSEDAIITDTKKVVATLNSLCAEMDQRYDLLKLAKTRNIKEYNVKFCSRKLSPLKGHRYLPYIVLIIDEFGDLIMTAGREVEMPIARLAQLARAIGIHLIIATQRPSVNIITGIIKANFPARIAFRVSSKIDSRTILDGSGADQLIGKGDMLISTGSDLIRLQCAFVDTPEVEKITSAIEEQQAYPEPFYLPEIPEDGKDLQEDLPLSLDEIDPEFVEAATLIVQTQQGSTSFIQRKLKLGYNRAGRIMDQLEEFDIVDVANGSKPREVKVKTIEELNAILRKMGL